MGNPEGVPQTPPASDGCGAFDAHIAARGTSGVLPEDADRLRAHLAACERCRDLAGLFESGVAVSATGSEDASPASGPRAEGAVVAGRYRLERVLGGGGMGVVWAATQTATRQPVAIKFLRGAGDQARRRLLREARAACAVRHPNVVRVFDVLELPDGSPALVMERFAGGSLRRLFEVGPVDLARLCGILDQVAAALGAAHAAGVVHRDLKPDNVFLTTDGEPEVRLLDFGIAKHRPLDQGLGSGTLTSSGAIVGTPYYMSPEQALGEEDVDARADLWALGILLYQGLSGVLPTRGDNLGQVIKAIALTGIEPLERLVPGLPEDVASLSARLLAKAPAQRPALADVREVLGRHAQASSSLPAVSRARPRTRATVVGAGLAALVVAAGLLAARGAVSARRAAGAPAPSGVQAAGTVAPAGSCPPEMVRVEGGGDQAGFCMDRTEVTTLAYTACVQRGPCTPASAKEVWLIPRRWVGRHTMCNYGVQGREEYPINCLVWAQADTYCRAAGKRLPTADEWHWAARGGLSDHRFAWGDDLPREDQICWHVEETCPVGAHPGGATPAGIMDLAGNVWERTSTPGPDTKSHIQCGGGIYERDSGDVTIGRSSPIWDDEQFHDVGFRCVK